MSTISCLVFLSHLFILSHHIDCQSERLDIDFYLHTRASRIHQSLDIDDKEALEASHYDGSHKTIIIIHGYLDNIKYTTWAKRLTRELLRYADYNVILVDWSKFNRYFYDEAVHNIVRVGEEISKFIKFLQNSTGTDPQLFHIIGHSLGAHMAGHVGKNTPNLGRITGLDPAGPNFQNVLPSERLDKSDAQFVDVIHTDAANDIANGLGTTEVIGHADFFPNGGNGQPGCANDILFSFLKDGLYRGASHLIACDHLRTLDLFIYSINNKHCLPVGISCRSWRSFRRGRCGDCGNEGSRCAKMGFHADENKAVLNKSAHIFFLKTPSYAPYCYHHYQIKVELAQPNNESVGISGLYLVLHGRKDSKRLTLTEGFNTLSGNELYPYLITLEHELDGITKAEFRWVDDSHYDYPPYSFHQSDEPSSKPSSKFYLKKIRISPITLRQSVHYFCGDPEKSLISNEKIVLNASTTSC